MKKIIGSGKSRMMANTTTADLIKEKKEGRGLRRINEKLYQAPNGRYFVYGYGGTLTRWSGGIDIIGPLNEMAIKKWIGKKNVKKNIKNRK